MLRKNNQMHVLPMLGLHIKGLMGQRPTWARIYILL
jgi:hypothetical protein